MQDLHVYLEKFFFLAPPEKTIKKAVCDSIDAVCGISIKHENIAISQKTVFLNTDSLVKGEILMHKSDILSRLRTTVPGKVVISDIR